MARGKEKRGAGAPQVPFREHPQGPENFPSGLTSHRSPALPVVPPWEDRFFHRNSEECLQS